MKKLVLSEEERKLLLDIAESNLSYDSTLDEVGDAITQSIANIIDRRSRELELMWNTLENNGSWRDAGFLEKFNHLLNQTGKTAVILDTEDSNINAVPGNDGLWGMTFDEISSLMKNLLGKNAVPKYKATMVTIGIDGKVQSKQLSPQRYMYSNVVIIDKKTKDVLKTIGDVLRRGELN